MAAKRKKRRPPVSGGVIPQTEGGRYIPGKGEKPTRLPDRLQVDVAGPEPDYLSPPAGSYDPSISAQLRASQRGLSDLREDTRTANKWASKDYGTERFNIKRGFKRGRQDLRRQTGRERQKLGFRRQDLNTDIGRGREDISSRLAGVSRQFSNLASSQEEGRNAAGTLGGGTAAAAAQKRAENQALAVAPIKTAASRMEQDYGTNVGRLNVAGQQLTQDSRQSLSRMIQDTRQDKRLTKRDFGRGKFDRNRKLQRGIREQTQGEADLTEQMVFSARQLNPGAFSRFGKKKPGKKVF